jgi:phage/plasmid-like protein (TIGR03299 family)
VLAEDAITLAGLDWEVKMLPIQVPLVGYVDEPDVDNLTPSDWRATVRMDRNEVLGIVGKNFKVVQNKEAFGFMDDLVGPGRLARYHTAGALRGGKKVWMLAEVQNLCMEPVKDDVVNMFLLMSNAHDGSSELNVAWTTVRVVCANTLRIALAGAKQKVAIRHSGDVAQKLAAQKEILGLTNIVYKRVQDEFAELAKKSISDKVLDKILLELIPDPPAGVDPTRAQNSRDAIQELYQLGTGAELPGVAGTAWGVLNAVTDFTSHTRPTRGGGKDPLLTQEKRLDSVWFGSGDALNQKALKLLLTA